MTILQLLINIAQMIKFDLFSGDWQRETSCTRVQSVFTESHFIHMLQQPFNFHFARIIHLGPCGIVRFCHQNQSCNKYLLLTLLLLYGTVTLKLKVREIASLSE